MLPSGFLNKNSRVMIGPGVVVNPNVFLKEITDFGTDGRSFLDNNCGIIEKHHLEADSKGRLKEKIGSTGSRTGPVPSTNETLCPRPSGTTSISENKIAASNPNLSIGCIVTSTAKSGV